MIVICREMGWDYFTYVRQPSFFLGAIKDHMVRENKEMKKQLAKNKS